MRNLVESSQCLRKRKTKDPCVGCMLHKSLCICELIPSLDLSTRVSLVVHAKELKRTTNTGRLAVRALRNSEMLVRGVGGDGVDDRDDSVVRYSKLDLSGLLREDYQPLFFYPSDDAVELTTDFVGQFDKPIHLIVPDGNWRQASKVHIRHPELSTVPRVMLSRALLSSSSAAAVVAPLVMRTETKPEGMATLEAIAYALRVIEGDDVFAKLIRVYNAKLTATLAGRGQLPAVSKVFLFVCCFLALGV